jgi:hypothetical protein
VPAAEVREDGAGYSNGTEDVRVELRYKILFSAALSDDIIEISEKSQGHTARLPMIQ